MDVEYYCPKCKSTNIEITCLTPPEIVRMSIDELPLTGGIVMNDCVLRVNTYQAKCGDCGYSINYQR